MLIVLGSDMREKFDDLGNQLVSEELGGVKTLFHHVRQEFKGLALKVPRTVLNIVSDCVVPL